MEGQIWPVGLVLATCDIDQVCRSTEPVHLTGKTDCFPSLEFLCVDFETASSKYSGSWMKLLAAGKANSPEKWMNVVLQRRLCCVPELLAPLGLRKQTMII